MPKVDVGAYVANSNSGGTDEIRNPLSIWRNTVRVRPEEYAVIRFIDEGGDLSRYHNIPGMTQGGARFTNYTYCTDVNIKSDGNPVRAEACPHCMSMDPDIKKTTERFLGWIFHYGTFHTEQNPRLDREGQEPWDEVKRGQKIFYRETVRKPQLFAASFTLYQNLKTIRSEMDLLTSRNFDYRCIRSQDRTSYNLGFSDTQLSYDFANEITAISQDLPDIEGIAAGIIIEVDVPQFSEEGDGYTMSSTPDSQASVAREEGAYDTMLSSEATDG
jgi:hypothetical protein